MSRPRIILHIGRNKAGSTTIQRCCSDARDQLAAAGIGYGLFGHLWRHDPGLPGWATFDDLASHAAAHADRTWLVSNEFMSAWPREYTRDAGRALARCDVTIVAYLRRYDDWVCSSYAEDTRHGVNVRPIDDYLRHIRPRVSALANLADWADCFGWDRMRVRSVDPLDLVGGDLITDFADAIGLEAALPAVTRQNGAPHWTELELVRALVQSMYPDMPTDADTSDIARLADLFRVVVGGSGGGAEYLSADDRDALIALYAHDAATRRGHDITVTVPAGPFRQRAFVPSFEKIPGILLERWHAATAMPAFAEQHPAAAAAARRLALAGARPRTVLPAG